MAAVPEPHVWVFSNGRQSAGGVFSAVGLAEAWIGRHRLSGVLTAYPLDEGCFDWAVREGVTDLRADKLAEKGRDPDFVGGFTTASQPHYHYVDGRRA